MDASFYAYNKAKMDSKSQKCDDLCPSPPRLTAPQPDLFSQNCDLGSHQQNFQTEPPCTTGTSSHQPTVQYGYQNGYQNVNNFQSSYTYNSPLGQPPPSSSSSQNHSSALSGNLQPSVDFNQLPFENNASSSSFLPPSVNSHISYNLPAGTQGLTARPPFSPQSHLHAYVPPPLTNSLSFNGPFYNREAASNQLSASPSMTGSNSGSHQASRSDTPVDNSSSSKNFENQISSHNNLITSDLHNQTLTVAPQLSFQQPGFPADKVQNQSSVNQSQFSANNLIPTSLSQPQSWSQTQKQHQPVFQQRLPTVSPPSLQNPTSFSQPTNFQPSFQRPPSQFAPTFQRPAYQQPSAFSPPRLPTFGQQLPSQQQPLSYSQPPPTFSQPPSCPPTFSQPPSQQPPRYPQLSHQHPPSFSQPQYPPSFSQPQYPPTFQQPPVQNPPTFSQQPQQQRTLQQPWSEQPFNQSLPGSLNSLSLNQQPAGVSNLRLHNLTQERNIVPKDGFTIPDPVIRDATKTTNCSSDIMTCTLNAFPNCQSLLQKTRLPLGLLIHPFKDLSHLPLIQSSVIVRCRSCRTYINAFVVFVDPGRWRCNVCFKVNELSPDFNYDPLLNTYGDPTRRPEVRTSTIEYIATPEYLTRPPMPAVYLYLLDVSYNAVETGYLKIFCETLIDELDKIPGDSRKRIGFLAYDVSLYFFNLSDELTQPQLLVVSDLDEPSQPCPEGLLVNLQQSKEIVIDLLKKLPSMFENNQVVGNALGTALDIAMKMMTSTGGRISVFQTHLPTVGVGSLKNREELSDKTTKNVHALGPATDFYKKMALDCSSQQIAMDCFFFNSQYCDIATICGAAKHSGGCMHYFPGFHVVSNPVETKRFKCVLTRYLTRKIGFEAVMRVRCTKGISIQAYHGNLFVRSTDLLSLPNVNPDAAFAVQMSIDDTIDCNYVCMQTALLYTSTKAERRIRVHTLCIPVTTVQSDLETSANQFAIAGLLSKMAVDKSLNIGLGDSREALVNAAVDVLTAFGATLSPGQKIPNQILVPQSLKLMPLLVLALLKYKSFRIGYPTKIDDRVAAMELCKNLPLKLLLLHIHPSLYPIHNLDDELLNTSGDRSVTAPPMVSLSSTQLDKHGAYLMDAGSYMYLFLGPAISDDFCSNLLRIGTFSQSVEGMVELPCMENPLSEYMRTFVEQLNDDRPFFAPLILVRENGRLKNLFYQHLVEDRTESSFSYQEFLQHLQKEIKL